MQDPVDVNDSPEHATCAAVQCKEQLLVGIVKLGTRSEGPLEDGVQVDHDHKRQVDHIADPRQPKITVQLLRRGLQHWWQPRRRRQVLLLTAPRDEALIRELIEIEDERHGHRVEHHVDGGVGRRHQIGGAEGRSYG